MGCVGEWTQLEGEAPEILRVFHERVTLRYPDGETLSDEEIDQAVWSYTGLWDGFGPKAGDLAFIYSAAEELVPFLAQTASELGLVLFDCGADLVYRPDGLKHLALDVEDRALLAGPTLEQIHASVRALTPKGGPSFLVLSADPEPGMEEGDYAQTAGGDGSYTAEWREYAGKAFRHWVAGLPGQPAKRNVHIKTSEARVTVKENERLSADQVIEVLTAFATGAERPGSFVWRETTDEFE